MENLITNIGNIYIVDYFIYFNNSMNKEQSLFYCSNKKIATHQKTFLKFNFLEDNLESFAGCSHSLHDNVIILNNLSQQQNVVEK